MRRIANSTTMAVFLISLTGLISSLVVASDYGKVVIDDESPSSVSAWRICSTFERSILYSGDGFIKKVEFIGRYHGQYEDVSGHNGGADFGDRYWQHDRWRAGVRVELDSDLAFTNTYNLDNSQHFGGFQPDARFVETVEVMILEWNPTDDLYIIVGKQRPNVSRETSTSSNGILTFERSQIVNNVISDKIWGVAVGFRLGGLSHEVGVFSNVFDDDWSFPNFEGGATVTYRTSREVSDSTKVFFDYQYNDVNAGQAAGGNSTFRSSPYEHVFALGTETEVGQFGLITDLIYGAGLNGGNDDTFGIVFMPYFNVTDKLQFVTKYSYMEDGNMSSPQDRVRGTGLDNPNVDGLHTFYAGINYRICGDKLKLMGGYEYATASVQLTGVDYQSDAWLFGIRTHW